MLGDWTGRNGTCRGTLGGRKWRSNARLEPFATPSRARDVLGLPSGSLRDRRLGRGAHSPLPPSPPPAFDCGEQRVAEQINFLHTSLCAAPRPPGPRPRPRPAPTT